MSKEKQKKASKSSDTSSGSSFLDASMFDAGFGNFDFESFTGLDGSSVAVTSNNEIVVKEKKGDKKDKEEKKEKKDKEEKKEKKEKKDKEEKKEKKEKKDKNEALVFISLEELLGRPWLSTSTQSNYPSDGPLESVFRRMGKKKDFLTKVKALQEVESLLVVADNVCDSTTCFVSTFLALSCDANPRLRLDAVQNLLRPYCTLAKTNPSLAELVAYHSYEWAAALVRLTFDPNTDVASASKLLQEELFPVNDDSIETIFTLQCHFPVTLCPREVLYAHYFKPLLYSILLGIDLIATATDDDQWVAAFMYASFQAFDMICRHCVKLEAPFQSAQPSMRNNPFSAPTALQASLLEKMQASVKSNNVLVRKSVFSSGVLFLPLIAANTEQYMVFLTSACQETNTSVLPAALLFLVKLLPFLPTELYKKAITLVLKLVKGNNPHSKRAALPLLVALPKDVLSTYTDTPIKFCQALWQSTGIPLLSPLYMTKEAGQVFADQSVLAAHTAVEMPLKIPENGLPICAGTLRDHTTLLHGYTTSYSRDQVHSAVDAVLEIMDRLDSTSTQVQRELYYVFLLPLLYTCMVLGTIPVCVMDRVHVVSQRVQKVLFQFEQTGIYYDALRAIACTILPFVGQQVHNTYTFAQVNGKQTSTTSEQTEAYTAWLALTQLPKSEFYPSIGTVPYVGTRTSQEASVETPVHAVYTVVSSVLSAFDIRLKQMTTGGIFELFLHASLGSFLEDTMLTGLATLAGYIMQRVPCVLDTEDLSSFLLTFLDAPISLHSSPTHTISVFEPVDLVNAQEMTSFSSSNTLACYSEQEEAIQQQLFTILFASSQDQTGTIESFLQYLIAAHPTGNASKAKWALLVEVLFRNCNMTLQPSDALHTVITQILSILFAKQETPEQVYAAKCIVSLLQARSFPQNMYQNIEILTMDVQTQAVHACPPYRPFHKSALTMTEEISLMNPAFSQKVPKELELVLPVQFSHTTGISFHTIPYIVEIASVLCDTNDSMRNILCPLLLRLCYHFNEQISLAAQRVCAVDLHQKSGFLSTSHYTQAATEIGQLLSIWEPHFNPLASILPEDMFTQEALPYLSEQTDAELQILQHPRVNFSLSAWRIDLQAFDAHEQAITSAALGLVLCTKAIGGDWAAVVASLLPFDSILQFQQALQDTTNTVFALELVYRLQTMTSVCRNVCMQIGMHTVLLEAKKDTKLMDTILAILYTDIFLQRYKMYQGAIALDGAQALEELLHVSQKNGIVEEHALQTVSPLLAELAVLPMTSMFTAHVYTVLLKSILVYASAGQRFTYSSAYHHTKFGGLYHILTALDVAFLSNACEYVEKDVFSHIKAIPCKDVGFKEHLITRVFANQIITALQCTEEVVAVIALPESDELDMQFKYIGLELNVQYVQFAASYGITKVLGSTLDASIVDYIQGKNQTYPVSMPPFDMTTFNSTSYNTHVNQYSVFYLSKMDTCTDMETLFSGTIYSLPNPLHQEALLRIYANVSHSISKFVFPQYSPWSMLCTLLSNNSTNLVLPYYIQKFKTLQDICQTTLTYLLTHPALPLVYVAADTLCNCISSDKVQNEELPIIANIRLPDSLEQWFFTSSTKTQETTEFANRSKNIIQYLHARFPSELLRMLVHKPVFFNNANLSIAQQEANLQCHALFQQTVSRELLNNAFSHGYSWVDTDLDEETTSLTVLGTQLYPPLFELAHGSHLVQGYILAWTVQVKFLATKATLEEREVVSAFCLETGIARLAIDELYEQLCGSVNSIQLEYFMKQQLPYLLGSASNSKNQEDMNMNTPSTSLLDWLTQLLRQNQQDGQTPSELPLHSLLSLNSTLLYNNSIYNDKEYNNHALAALLHEVTHDTDVSLLSTFPALLFDDTNYAHTPYLHEIRLSSHIVDTLEQEEGTRAKHPSITQLNQRQYLHRKKNERGFVMPVPYDKNTTRSTTSLQQMLLPAPHSLYPQQFPTLAACNTNKHTNKNAMYLPHIAYAVLCNLFPLCPAIAQQWYQRLTPTLVPRVDQLLINNIAPVTVAMDLANLRLSAQKKPMKRMKITINNAPTKTTMGTVTATYKRESLQATLVISLARSHPLITPTLTVNTNLTGITENATMRWRHTIVRAISNGTSLYTCIELFSTIIEAQFDGKEMCPVCMDIVHETTHALPSMKCTTCSKAFHNICLMTWFETSGNATCPLCRSLF